jgi:hypothetical protein
MTNKETRNLLMKTEGEDEGLHVDAESMIKSEKLLEEDDRNPYSVGDLWRMTVSCLRAHPLGPLNCHLVHGMNTVSIKWMAREIDTYM